MNTARVLDNGDLRLPPEVASKLHVKPGDSVAIEVESDGTAHLYPNRTCTEGVAADTVKGREKTLNIAEFIRLTGGIRRRTAARPQTDSAVLVREDRER